MNLKLRLAIEWVIISLVATTVIIAFAHWHGPASFDNVVYDRLSSLAPAKADEGILIVAIDDPSIVELGKWPWQRSVHARLIERLQSARPRSITLDLILSESANRSTDSALAKSISGPSPVFLPLHFSSPGSNGRAFDTHLPTPILALAAKGIGHVNLDFGHDGIVRHAALCFQSEKSGQAWPHIMELVYRLDNTAPSPAYTQSGRCGSELLIPFARRGTFTEISYAEILNSNVPDEFISGRDVIIGATAAGLGDNFPVPNGNRGLLSGVEIMANMLGAMRRDDFIRPLGMQWVVALSLFPTWLLLIGFLRWRPRAVLAMSIMMIVMILLVSVGLLRSRIWFPPGTALLGVLLIYPLWGWRRLQ
ncbi:MAG: CHASE2 domain-containing protein, partial [Sphingorhabdus sp.]